MTIEELQRELDEERKARTQEVERLKAEHNAALEEQRKIISALMERGNNDKEQKKGDSTSEMQREIEKINERRKKNV